MSEIIIIGAGLAGLSAAYHFDKLGVNYTMIEKESRVGGLCRTYCKEGFTFDKCLHVVHMKNPYIKELVMTLFGKNLVEHTRRALVNIYGDMLPYPFQAYFFLSSKKKVVDDCIRGLLETEKNKKANINNFEEYIKKYFGSGIAEHFMIPYNKKLWTVPLSKLSYDWARKFVPTPSASEVLRNIGTYSKADKEWGYNPRFFYPTRGGIEEVSKAFFKKIRRGKVLLEKMPIKIDIKQKRITLDNGEKLSYDALISTIPLPESVNIINKAPINIRRLSSDLRYISIVNFNFGINAENNLNAHWIYFPAKKIIFHRVGFPSNLSPYMAPKGCSSISVEISYSKNKPLEKREIERKIIKDLEKTHILKSPEQIIATKVFDIKYAYVICDEKYFGVRSIIHHFLENHSIFSIGRYGSWDYSTMEDTIIEGRKITEKIFREECKEQ